MDFSWVESFIVQVHQLGIIGYFAVFLLDAGQFFVPVIPQSFIITTTSMVFGAGPACVVIWLATQTGSSLIYWLARRYGSRRFIEWFDGRYEFDLRTIEEKHHFVVLFLLRLFPVLPLMVINAGSGLAGVRYRIFFITTAVGTAIWIPMFAYLGDYLVKSQNIFGTLVLLAAMSLVILAGGAWVRKRLPSYQKSPAQGEESQA